MQRFFKVVLSEKSNFDPLLLVDDWSDRKSEKIAIRVCSVLQHIQSSFKSVRHKLSYARQKIDLVQICDFGAKNGPVKKIANGSAAKNTEQMRAF